MKRLSIAVLIVLLISTTGCNVSDSNYNPNLGTPLSYQTEIKWIHSSVPVSIMNRLNLDDLELQKYRGNLYWDNTKISSSVLLQENQNPENEIEVLNLVYDPFKKGCFNKSKSYQRTDSSWGGITTTLMYNDKIKIEENQKLSMWLNYDGDINELLLNLDFGEISEDITSDGIMGTEDKNQNDIFNFGEDTGIDGRKNENEEGFGAANLDPNNDNYSDDGKERINYPEGNGRMDSEDLNKNYTLDKRNNYYRIKMEMGVNVFPDQKNENGWMKVIISMQNYTEKIGEPEMREDKLDRIRIWMSGDKKIALKIAEISIQ